jgi:hypothetical protein
MVFAIATLFFQFAPSVQAIPIAAATAAKASVSEPNSLSLNLPAPPADADVNVIAVKAAASEARLDANSATDGSPNGEPGSVRPSSTMIAAQDTQALSGIRIPVAASAKTSDLIGVERYPSPRKWVALSLVQHGAAAFDAYSTRDAISHGAIEADPLMRPFVNSSAIYAAIQVMPVALDYTARRMQRSPNNFIRRIWWVPQSISTASFLFPGVHNLHVAGER